MKYCTFEFMVKDVEVELMYFRIVNGTQFLKPHKLNKEYFTYHFDYQLVHTHSKMHRASLMGTRFNRSVIFQHFPFFKFNQITKPCIIKEKNLYYIDFTQFDHHFDAIANPKNRLDLDKDQESKVFK